MRLGTLCGHLFKCFVLVLRFLSHRGAKTPTRAKTRILTVPLVRTALSQQPFEDASLRALAALARALAGNPLSRKLFVSGGHLRRLPVLLTILKPGDISERPLVQRQQTASTTRRRWGWGGGRDKNRGAAAANGVKDGAGGAPHAASSPSSSGGGGGGEKDNGADGGGGGWSGEVPFDRIRATLSLVSALVGCCREETGATAAAAAAAVAAADTAPGAATGDKHGFVVAGSRAAGEDEVAAYGVRAAVGDEGGLLQAVCELALASTRAPAGGGATWAEYGLPEDCQRSALGILTSLVSRHPGNQVR